MGWEFGWEFWRIEWPSAAVVVALAVVPLWVFSRIRPEFPSRHRSNRRTNRYQPRSWWRISAAIPEQSKGGS